MMPRFSLRERLKKELFEEVSEEQYKGLKHYIENTIDYLYRIKHSCIDTEIDNIEVVTDLIEEKIKGYEDDEELKHLMERLDNWFDSIHIMSGGI